MRFSYDEIEDLSNMIENDKWVGYPMQLFSNLLEYTCPELFKFKYMKLAGFAYYGEDEYLSITDDFFAKVKLRENLYVSEFGVYRRAIGFVYKDEIYVITPDKDDLVIIYILDKETRARKVYRDIHKSKVLDFIEGKYIQEKSDKDFGFTGILIDYDTLKIRNYPKIEDLFILNICDVDNDKDLGSKSIYAHLPHDEEEGVEIYYEENWSYIPLGSMKPWEDEYDYYYDDDWDEEDEWE